MSDVGGSAASSTFRVDSPAGRASPTNPPLPEQLRLPHRALSKPPDTDIVSPPFEMLLAVPDTSDDVPPVYFNQRLITPVMPEATQRYDRRPRIQKEGISLNIPPNLTDFSQPHPPAGWQRRVHPEGARYFRHNEKHAFTDADLSDPKIHRRAEEVLTLLDEFITEHDLPLPESWDVVIDLFYEGEEILATYYYVGHRARCIFFLDDFRVANLARAQELSTVNTYQHFSHEIEAQYWYFLLLYPCALELSRSQVREFKSIILHHIGDCISSAYSTSPFTVEDLYKLISLSNALESAYR